MKVILRPLNTNNWAGVTHYKNCYSDLAPYFIEGGNGRIYNGFNPPNATEDELEVLEKERKILSKALHTDLSDKSEYWTNYFIRIKDDDVVLDDQEAEDKLKLIFLRNHFEVKRSSYEPKPQAKYVLIDEEKDAEYGLKKMRAKEEAYDAKKKMTEQDIKDALRLYGERSDDMSQSVAEVRLTDYLERDPKRFLELWVNNKGRKTLVLIEKAIVKGVVRRTNRMYSYGTTSLGTTPNEAIAFLEDPKNQDIKLAIMGSIGIKT
mgnify:CR=1 FL=1